MKISIIAAMDEKRGIGKNNKIPWHIKEDFKRFKEKTFGHAVIMGRKTWESLPIKPLPNRFNIVVSRKANRLEKGSIVVFSPDKALEIGRQYEQEKFEESRREVFIIGGQQIFEQALPLADKLYLTIIEGDFGADAFFPDYSEFKKKKVIGEGESEGHKYTFLELER